MLIDAITWTADPAIFSIFGREVRWYGLFFAVGFLVGYAIEERIYKHDNAPAGWCDKAFIYTIIATIIGARLGHCLFYGWEYYSAHPLDILKIWEGGLASHGGTIGILIALYIFSRRVTHRDMLCRRPVGYPYGPCRCPYPHGQSHEPRNLRTCNLFALGIPIYRKCECVAYLRSTAHLHRAVAPDANL